MHTVSRTSIQFVLGMVLNLALMPAEPPSNNTFMELGTLITSTLTFSRSLSEACLQLHMKLVELFPYRTHASAFATQAAIKALQNKFLLPHAIAAAYLGTPDAIDALAQTDKQSSLDTFLQAARIFDGTLQSDAALTLLSATAVPIKLNSFFCNELSLDNQNPLAPLTSNDSYTLLSSVNNDASYYALRCQFSLEPWLTLEHHMEQKQDRAFGKHHDEGYINLSNYCTRIIPMGIVEQANGDLACVGHARNGKKPYFFLCRFSKNRAVKQFMKYSFNCDLPYPEAIKCIDLRTNKSFYLTMND